MYTQRVIDKRKSLSENVERPETEHFQIFKKRQTLSKPARIVRRKLKLTKVFKVDQYSDYS